MIEEDGTLRLWFDVSNSNGVNSNKFSHDHTRTHRGFQTPTE